VVRSYLGKTGEKEEQREHGKLVQFVTHVPKDMFFPTVK
jgi:hypothetical protein